MDERELKDELLGLHCELSNRRRRSRATDQTKVSLAEVRNSGDSTGPKDLKSLEEQLARQDAGLHFGMQDLSSREQTHLAGKGSAVRNVQSSAQTDGNYAEEEEGSMYTLKQATCHGQDGPSPQVAAEKRPFANARKSQNRSNDKQHPEMGESFDSGESRAKRVAIG